MVVDKGSACGNAVVEGATIGMQKKKEKEKERKAAERKYSGKECEEIKREKRVWVRNGEHLGGKIEW